MASKYTVREARRKSGISVPAIAESLGVSATAVWNWDRGKSRPRPDMAERLASLLGTTTAHLFAQADSPIGHDKDDTYLTCGEILDETKERLARKLGIPRDAFDLSIHIKR